MRIKNLPSIESMDGSQDALVIEQTDGSEDKSRKVSPAQIKQFIEAGDFVATGEITDGHGNVLKNMAKSAIIGDLSQTGLTGASVAAQLGDASGQISSLKTPTLIWEGSATVVDNIYNMTGNYTDYKYLLVTAKTNVEEKNILIPTSRISPTTIFPDALSAGAWNTTTNAFTYNSNYGIKFTDANKFQLVGLSYNNSNWILKPVKIYGIG